MGEHQQRRRKQLVVRTTSAQGFTLIELVVVVTVLGIMAVVVIPRFANLADAAKSTAAREELRRLKTAIVGTAGPDGIPRGGYELDVGYPPGKLADLAIRPDSVAVWNRFVGRGWNGPYIDSSGQSYLKDPWDSAYRYDAAARTIKSVGGGSDIVVSF